MSQTSKLDLTKPAEGSENWGGDVNANWEKLDPVVVVSGTAPTSQSVAVGRIVAYIDEANDKVYSYVKCGTVNLERGYKDLARQSDLPRPGTMGSSGVQTTHLGQC